MSLTKPRFIEEHILCRLQGGPRKATDLLAEIGESRKLTKQGFYAALRKLKEDEEVVAYKGTVSLNTAWVRAMEEAADAMRAAYLPGNERAGMFALGAGESVSYVFANTRHLDAFWGHAQSAIIARTPASEPVYSYDPHYWFYIARESTEKKLVADIAKAGRQFLMTAGGETYLDRSIRADFNGDSLQYHMERIFDARNKYVVVIGEYITEVMLDPKVAEQIDAVYRSARSLDASASEALAKMLAVRARHKIRISRNARKAQGLKAKLGKNFFIRSANSEEM